MAYNSARLAEAARMAIRAMPQLDEGALCARLRVDRHTLARALGVPFRSLRAAARLERAQGQLTEPSLTVAEVAFAIGFDSPSSFCRFFRMHTGLTPSEFRSGQTRLAESQSRKVAKSQGRKVAKSRAAVADLGYKIHATSRLRGKSCRLG